MDLSASYKQLEACWYNKAGRGGVEGVAGWWSKERPCFEAASAVSGRGSIGQWREGKLAEGNNNFIQHQKHNNTQRATTHILHFIERNTVKLKQLCCYLE